MTLGLFFFLYVPIRIVQLLFDVIIYLFIRQ